MADLPARVLFGTAYYHEYRPAYHQGPREDRPGERLKLNPIRAGTDLALGAWDVRILFRPVREKA